MTALKFSGRGGEYFKIWIVNIMLSIVTFGLYFPWAKVRNHRYFYGNTTLEGRNFEYHATGKQLFLGYIIGMILFIIYVSIQQVSPIGSLVVLVIFFFFLPWIVWRSLRFSMKMTSFSNVRFSFVGDLGQAYTNFLAYPLLMMVIMYGVPGVMLFASMKMHYTLPSWAYIVVVIIDFALVVWLSAYLNKINTEYVLDNARYGQGAFRVDVETNKFLSIMIKTFLLSLLAFAAAVLFAGAVAYLTIGIDKIMELRNMEQGVDSNIELIMMSTIFFVYGGMILFGTLVMAYYYARRREYVYGNMSLDHKITFASTLRARSFAWVMISNIFLIVITLGIAIPWTKVRTAKLLIETTEVDAQGGLDEYVTQRQDEESSLGDQIGDAFDVDVGIGF